MSELYETDILLWSEEQAARLRRLAGSDRSNTDGPDWPNIIEEIESVGSEQLHAVESLWVQALVHMLKSEAWPSTPYVSGWRAEAQRFRDDAASRFAPSMRERIDLGRIYRRALRALPETVDGLPPLPVPAECPMTLDELLSDPSAEAAR